MKIVALALGILVSFGSVSFACNGKKSINLNKIVETYKNNLVRAKKIYENKDLYISGLIQKVESRNISTLIYFDDNFQVRLDKNKYGSPTVMNANNRVVICGNVSGYIGFTDVIQIKSASITHVYNNTSNSWKKVSANNTP